MKEKVILTAIVCAFAAVQGWAADSVWVKVAAADSPAAAKAKADFVCAGTNDQETIQKAIDQCAKSGRNLFLYDGVYMIDAFRDWKDGGPRAAVRIPKMLRHLTIEGQKFFQGGRSTIPEDWKEWKNGVIWYARSSIWTTAGDGVPSILRGEWCRCSSQNGSGLRLQNVSVFMCDAQHPARCVDLRWTDAVEVRNMRLYGIGYRLLNGDTHPYKKFGPLKMPHVDAIGITMTSGSNIPVSRFDNIVAIGFGQGFQVGGEHVICNNCLGSLCLYGWTFGNYMYSAGAHVHPIVLINCADERNVHRPLFADKSGCRTRHQSVTMIGFNFELMESLVIGGKLGDGMRETVPGTWSGHIEYTVMPKEGAGNAVEFPLWEEDGSGSGFETRNLAHKRVGTSAERRKYYPQLGQQFFDTDLGKLLICTDPAKRKWVDAMGVPVDERMAPPERMKPIY